MLRKLISLTLFLLLATISSAQENQDCIQLAGSIFKAKKIIPPTPEAAALGKYGNVPISLFTGTPSVSIPLYQLSGTNISMPVQLTYNAGGFSPQEIATWVGLGWSLNAGGVVTRSVMGNPDVISNYFKTPSPLVVPSQTTDPFGYADYMDNLRKGYNEAQSDVYYYNFAGHTGKFFINPDNSIFKKEKNNYLITAAVTSNIGSFITIKDDQGVLYEFMEYELSTMTPDDIGGVPMTTYTYPSTWCLTRILSADGTEEIGFTYYTTSLEHNQFNNLYQSESDIYEQTINAAGQNSFTGPNLGSSTPATVKTKRKYLQQITFKRAGQLLSYIDFISGIDQRQDLDHSTTSGFPGERLLTAINIYTKNTPSAFSLTKQYNLNYGYFTNSGQALWQYKRLRLDNIQEVPVIAGTATPPPYVFAYNNDNLMPSLSSTQMDHWGFFNQSGSSRLVPTAIINSSTGVITVTAANRAPSLTGSSSYLINKLTYPTGGYTMFEYELNRAKDGSYVNAPIFDVGGVRIKKITDYSFTNKKATEKNYLYELADNTTSGRATFPEYMSSSQFTSYGSLIIGGSPCTADFLSKKTTTTISANSIFGLGSVQGSHIGYSRVTEMMSDVSNGQPLGKTVYEYYVRDATWDAHDDDIGNGDILKKSVFDNGGKLIEETSNTYNYILQGAVGAVSPGVSGLQDNKNILAQTNAPGGGYAYGWFLSASCATNPLSTKLVKTKYINAGWSVTSKEKQLIQQTAKKYDQLSNNYLIITKKFTYGNTAHTLPTSIEQTTTNGEVVVTDKRYSLDYTIPGSGTLDQNTQGIKLLQDKNIIGAEIESVQRRQNADGTNKRYINGLLTTYNPAIPYPSVLYRLETASPLTTFQLSSVNAGILSFHANYKPAGSFTYLSNGALLEQSKNLDMPSAYIWDHDYRYPTAEVLNANAGRVAYSSFETDGTGEWTTITNISANRITGGVTGKYSYNLITGNSITKSGLVTSRQYKVSYSSASGAVTVTPDAGIATSVTGPVHGSWTYYEHVLPANTSAVTLTAVAKNIDELRLYPADAFMTTVAYDPRVGIISQSSANNEIANFEYDGLGRLVNAKDEDANIVKNFKYKFGTDLSSITPSAQTLFYSALKQGAFTKQGCPAGAEGTVVNYIVPYGKYTALDQVSADAKAQADVTANGQTYANANGQCLYWNVLKSQLFSKNNCLPEQGGSKCSNTGPIQQQGKIAYTVPAHTYSSPVDLITANNSALADIAANGQNYANTYCWCSCGGIGQKVVNGICETGVRYNSSTTFMGNGIWQCTYYYLFSDNSVSPFYTEQNTTPCQIQ
jgi:hypothetical protein